MRNRQAHLRLLVFAQKVTPVLCTMTEQAVRHRETIKGESLPTRGVCPLNKDILAIITDS